MYTIDSCVLLDYPNIIKELKDEGIYILTDVLKELDGLKISSNLEVAFKARRAATQILNYIEDISFDASYEQEKIAVDDKLIRFASEQNLDLVTNDLYLTIRAGASGINVCNYYSDFNYTGIKYLDFDLDESGYNSELNQIFDELQYPDLYNNEYLIIRDNKDKSVLSILHNSENSLKPIVPKPIRNSWINEIYPKNPEQQCLFHALQNKSVSIIYAGGSFGTGKSFILNNFALQELEKGKINKIVYVPNNSYTANTLDIGALPGELLEKITGQIGPLIDLIGIDAITAAIKKEQLEIVPMNSIRGRSFTDSIIIVNEAQNLTEDHVKLLIGRCDKGTRIFFDGDYKQTDSPIFKNKNGLKLLLNLSKSEEFASIFATVKLTTIERSKTARAADYLDSITGGI